MVYYIPKESKLSFYTVSNENFEFELISVCQISTPILFSGNHKFESSAIIPVKFSRNFFIFFYLQEYFPFILLIYTMILYSVIARKFHYWISEWDLIIYLKVGLMEAPQYGGGVVARSTQIEHEKRTGWKFRPNDRPQLTRPKQWPPALPVIVVKNE